MTNPETPAPMTDEEFDEVWRATNGAIDTFVPSDEPNNRYYSQVSRALAELRRHRSSPPTAAGGWQAIEGAPKGGVEFQAWVGHWEPRCRFDPDTEAFEIWGRTDYDQDGWDIYMHLKPTHFMPQPEPPQ